MLLLPIWEVMGLSCDYYNPFAEGLSVTSGDVNRAIEDYLCAEGFPKFPMINYDGEPLRDLAKAAGQLTQKEMATALNMSGPTISRRLDDPEKITMDEFRDIAMLFLSGAGDDSTRDRICRSLFAIGRRTPRDIIHDSEMAMREEIAEVAAELSGEDLLVAFKLMRALRNQAELDRCSLSYFPRKEALKKDSFGRIRDGRSKARAFGELFGGSVVVRSKRGETPRLRQLSTGFEDRYRTALHTEE